MVKFYIRRFYYARSGYRPCLCLSLSIVSLKGPFAVKAAKSAIDHGMEIDLTNGLLLEKEYYSLVSRSCCLILVIT